MFGLTPFRKRGNEVGKISNWNPWVEMDKAFDCFFDDSCRFPLFQHDGTMHVDIKETEQAYMVEAEIPGVDKKNIQLELHDDILTIAVQHDEQVNMEKDHYIRRERRAVSMSRSFYVENVKEEDVEAKYENGILHITLPKRDPGIRKGRSIDIQ